MNYSKSKKPLANGENCYELRVWGRGRNRKSLRRRFKTRNEMDGFLATLLSQGDDWANQKIWAVEKSCLEDVPDEIKTVSNAVNYYKVNRYPELKPGSRINFDTYWDELKTLNVSLADMAFDQLRVSVATDLKTKLLKNGNSSKTANNKLAFLRSVLNYLVKNQKIESHKLAGLCLKKGDEKPIEYWEQDDAQDFLAFAHSRYPRGSKKRWVYLVYLIAINCGLRAGEIWALKPCCLKPSLNLLQISERWCAKVTQFAIPKGKRGRHVPLSPDLLPELEEWIHDNGIARYNLLFSKQEDQAQTPVVTQANFCSTYFRPDVRAWKGPSLKFHGMRHTAATLMLASGLNVRVVQEILGHTDIKTTMRYVHLQSKDIQAAARSYSIKPTNRPQLRSV